MTCSSCRGLGRLPSGERCACNPDHPDLVWARKRLTQAQSEQLRNSNLMDSTSKAESEYALYLQDFAVHTAEITLLQTFIRKLDP